MALIWSYLCFPHSYLLSKLRRLLIIHQVRPPLDHTDPELLFDQLPQPYRTVVKILEQDILDNAWEVLTRRHPELMLPAIDGARRRSGPLLELENVVLVRKKTVQLVRNCIGKIHS